jgi:hypothetical protein
MDFALRSKMQRRVDVVRVGQTPMLQGVAATPITAMGDAEVQDQAPAASLVPEVILDLHVAAPLARAGGNAVLRVGCGPCVPLSEKEGQGQIPYSHFAMSCACASVVAVSFDGGKYGNHESKCCGDKSLPELLVKSVVGTRWTDGPEPCEVLAVEVAGCRLAPPGRSSQR